MDKKRSIWKNLGWALAATPMVSFVGLILITLIGVIDDAITKIQLAGYWWLILVIAYILSLVYFLFEPNVRKNLEKKDSKCPYPLLEGTTRKTGQKPTIE